MKTQLTRNLFGATVAASLLCGVTNANALVSEDFEGATGPFPTDVTGSNTVFDITVGTGGGNTARILDSGSPFGTGNYMELVDVTTTSSALGVTTTFAEAIVDPFEVNFSFYDLAPAAGDEGSGEDWQFHILGGSNVASGSGRLFQTGFKQGAISPTSTNGAASTYALGQVNDIRLVVNQTDEAIVYDGSVVLNAEKYHVYLNGSLVTFTDQDSNLLTEMNFRTPGDAVTQIGFRVGGTNDAMHAYFDNFSVGIIPEPASLALLGLGGLMMIRRRKA